MTPAEWLADAVVQMTKWEAVHKSLDEARAALPSDADREIMRASGNRNLADQMDAAERGFADEMRGLDAQVKRTTVDVQRTVSAMSRADLASSRAALRGLPQDLPRVIWATSLVDERAKAQVATKQLSLADRNEVLFPAWLVVAALLFAGTRR